MQAHDPYVLPLGLPVPVDDGACDHLAGARVPLGLCFPSTAGGVVDVAELSAKRAVLFVYPRTGTPGVPVPAGWDETPGARGCTPQACAFRDHYAELAALGVSVAGLSAQAPAEQDEFARRNRLPYPLLSDAGLRLAAVMGLPTFEIAGMILYRRVTLVLASRRVEKLFYPVFPPNENAAAVAGWLRASPAAAG